MAVVLLPNAKQQFEDGNGDPLAGGSVYMYVPNTSPPVFATTWQDINQIAENTNPIILDADGRAIIWGSGIYRQVVYDLNGVLVWDEITSTPIEPASTDFYTLPVFIEGKPGNAEVYPIFNADRTLVLPAGLAGSIVTVATLPTVSSTFTLYKNSSSIGTIVFDTAGIPAITFAADVTFMAADQFKLASQAVADATGANMAFSFVFAIG